MPKTSTPKCLTLGCVAEALGVPVHRVAYILRTRPHIRPRVIAGHMRVFDAKGVALIRAELNAIESRRIHRTEVNHG
jgi:hypothetical protein